MMEMKISQAIYSMCEFARKLVHGENQAILFRMDFRYIHFHDGKEYRASGDADLIMRFPRGQYGYVNVFWREHKRNDGTWYMINSLPWDEFENISNHDDCWRQAIEQKIFALYMRLTRKVIAEVEAGPGYIVDGPMPERKPTRVLMAPKDVTGFNHFQTIEVLDIELEKVYNRYGDMYKIKGAKVKENK